MAPAAADARGPAGFSLARGQAGPRGSARAATKAPSQGRAQAGRVEVRRGRTARGIGEAREAGCAGEWPGLLPPRHRHGRRAPRPGRQAQEVLATGVQTLVVEPDEADMRVDRFLVARFPQLAFTHIQRIVRKGELRIDGKRAQAERSARSRARKCAFRR